MQENITREVQPISYGGRFVLKTVVGRIVVRTGMIDA